jgi:hypothetical protein
MIVVPGSSAKAVRLTPGRTKTKVPAGASTARRRARTSLDRVDEMELFLPVPHLGLIVLVDDPVARLASGPGVDAEGRDPEVVSDRPRSTAAVADLVDFLELRHCVTTHLGLLQGRRVEPGNRARG